MDVAFSVVLFVEGYFLQSSWNISFCSAMFKVREKPALYKQPEADPHVILCKQDEFVILCVPEVWQRLARSIRQWKRPLIFCRSKKWQGCGTSTTISEYWGDVVIDGSMHCFRAVRYLEMARWMTSSFKESLTTSKYDYNSLSDSLLLFHANVIDGIYSSSALKRLLIALANVPVTYFLYQRYHCFREIYLCHMRARI